MISFIKFTFFQEITSVEDVKTLGLYLEYHPGDTEYHLNTNQKCMKQVVGFFNAVEQFSYIMVQIQHCQVVFSVCQSGYSHSFL